MRKIRGQQTWQVGVDPWQGDEQVLEKGEVAHVVSDDGGIESEEVLKKVAAGCGCLRPAAGFCAICAQTACEKCFGFCFRCSKPLDAVHSIFVITPDGHRIRFCEPCYQSESRKNFWKSIGKSFFSPFFRFEDQHGKG